MRLTKRQRNKQKITMTVKELEKVKRDATSNAVKITQLFPLWVLRNQGWGELGVLWMSMMNYGTRITEAMFR